MLDDIQAVIRVLLTEVHRQDEQPRRITETGGLLILISAKYVMTYDQPICTIAAAGPWCRSVSKDETQSVLMEKLPMSASHCTCPDEEEIHTFMESFGSPHFIVSLPIYITYKAKTQSLTADLLKIQRFLHRLSLVHSRVEILFKFKSIDYTYHHTFGGKAEARVSGMDQAIVMDSTRYGLCPFSRGPLPSCSRLHPVLGERVELSLSSEAVETGLCGEISFVPMATLGPCMAQYPNWPTRLSRIHVFVYGPCKMPLMRAAGEEPMSFLRKLAASLSWTELGLSGVHYTELQPNEDYPYADIEFLVETDVHPEREPEGSTVIRQEPKPECNHAIEQSITLFFLLQHNDPFQSQLSDFITSEEVLERHLDRLLWLNREKVQASLQSVLQNTLMSYKKRQMAKRKMQSALSVMLNSMTSVVSSSSSARFRTACLDYMRVQDTHELSASLRQSFQRITDSRFVPSCGCRAGKIEEGVNFHQNGSGTREDLVLKRAHQRGQTSCGSKKQCSEKTNVTPSSYCPSTSRMTIFLMQPSQSQHSHLGNTTPSSSSSGTSEFENEQVEKEWLQEIENIPEWD